MADTQTASRSSSKRSTNVWSDEERAAMREGAREKKAAGRLSPEEERAQGEREVLAKIADMPEPDRTMGRRIHEIVAAAVPTLVPRTYYGMPAYSKDGKVICFFKPKSKFKVRYATFEFQPDATLDDGSMWPTAFALTELTPTNEARIAELVRTASS